MCISNFRSNEFCSSESWRIGIERFGGTHNEILRMHLVRSKIRERKRQSGGIIPKSENHKRNPCAPSFEEQHLRKTSRKADCDSKVAWKLARKMHKGSVKLFQKIVASDPVTTRSDKHACGKPMLTDTDKQAMGNREPAYENFSDEMHKENPTQGIPDRLQPFTVNLKDLEMHVLAHSSERVNSDSEGETSTVEMQKRKHSILTHFRKYRKRSVLPTEEIGDLKTVERKSESRNNHSSLPWYKISLPV